MSQQAFKSTLEEINQQIHETKKLVKDEEFQERAVRAKYSEALSIALLAKATLIAGHK